MVRASLLKRLLILLTLNYAASSFIAPSNFGGASESGVSLSDVTQRKSGSEYVALDNGRATKAASQGFDKGERGAHGQSQEDGHYSDQDNNRKGYDVGRQTLGQSQSFDQGNNEFQQHGSGEHKKGFHKSGFTNNYHKDESGNKASFYEDSDDERGHRGHDNRGSFYGNRGEDAFRDGRYDTAFNGRNRGQQGLYDNSAGFDNRRGHSGGYNDNRYYDDRRKYLQDGAGRAYDRNGNEAYYRREQPYHNNAYYPAPVAPLVSGPLYSRDYLDAPPARYFEREEPYRLGKRYGFILDRRRRCLVLHDTVQLSTTIPTLC
ncbi:uncharacterized protein DDB_G0290685-like isoform X2 [Athalia rosae]|uniref:uncharacterized protein DDB_G0290685-like isoform X2 n=1 Tax=Athalia rosae TaxID=37344 RepID=UPI002034787A|nr:uncharacterized protein DDB_G0290685-like isoform X2 [Athalia rosae]